MTAFRPNPRCADTIANDVLGLFWSGILQTQNAASVASRLWCGFVKMLGGHSLVLHLENWTEAAGLFYL